MNHLLISATNWLGDSIMSMPAIQAIAASNTWGKISLLVKPPLVELWQMHPSIDTIIPLESGISGARKAAAVIGEAECSEAVILPNSFRSALAPALAGVPVRRGRKGEWRRFLITDIHPASKGQGAHQSREYIELFGLPADIRLEHPALNISDDDQAQAASVFGLKQPNPQGQQWVGVLPGAARGPSKRWPAEQFVQTIRKFSDLGDYRFLILGSPAEASLCETIAASVGGTAVSLAGHTSLSQFAGLLKQCAVVISNDNGGMHLAAGVGTHVVAIFGLTDPLVTGPLGEGHAIVQAQGVSASRDIARESKAAEEALLSITPQEVIDAAARILTASVFIDEQDVDDEPPAS